MEGDPIRLESEDATETVPCSRCGSEYDPSHLKECVHCNELCCEECMIGDYCNLHGVQCNNCRVVMDIDDAMTCSHCDNYVCDDCYLGDNMCNECGRVCEHCDRIMLLDNAYWCDSCDTDVCENCYGGDNLCTECGRYVYCCESWFPRDDVTECSECGEHFCGQHISRCEEDDEWYCYPCHEERCGNEECNCEVEDPQATRRQRAQAEREAYERSRTLQGFSANPRIWDYGSSPTRWDMYKMPWENTRYLGLEIEMNFPATKWDAIKNVALKHLKDKHIWCGDSSIGCGAELIITPHTLKAHHHMINWMQLLQELKEAGANAYTSGRCGLHVHVNKNDMPRKNQLKICRFMQRNKSKMIGLSKRTQEGLSFGKIHEMKIKPGDIITGLHGQSPWNYDRNSCLNLNGDFQTIEFRLFRGTLCYERFKATLEFVDAICEFVTCHGFACINGTKSWKCFMMFIKEKYRILYNYIAMGGTQLANDYGG